MPEEETELTLSKEAEEAAAAAEPVAEMPAQEAGKEAAGEPPVARAEFDQLKAERDQLFDRLARLQAEFENARKRAERARLESRELVTGNVVEQFLPVLDDFELALKSDSSSHEQLRSGVELILKKLEGILRHLHVTAVATANVEFDPHCHQALGTVERQDLPDQHVAEEIRRGYKLHDRLLRPALVRVVSNPKQTSE